MYCQDEMGVGVDKGGAPTPFEMASDHDGSSVFRRFYSEIEAVLDPAAVARLLWQGGVLTDAQLDEAEHESTPISS